jgi:ferredoxin
MYNDWLARYGFQKIPPKVSDPNIHRIFEKDIPELGKYGLKIVEIGSILTTGFERCINCLKCVENCPENALTIENGETKVRTDLCSGMACLRCELSCPEKVFKYRDFLAKKEQKE